MCSHFLFSTTAYASSFYFREFLCLEAKFIVNRLQEIMWLPIPKSVYKSFYLSIDRGKNVTLRG